MSDLMGTTDIAIRNDARRCLVGETFTTTTGMVPGVGQMSKGLADMMAGELVPTHADNAALVTPLVQSLLAVQWGHSEYGDITAPNNVQCRRIGAALVAMIECQFVSELEDRIQIAEDEEQYNAE